MVFDLLISIDILHVEFLLLDVPELPIDLDVIEVVAMIAMRLLAWLMRC